MIHVRAVAIALMALFAAVATAADPERPPNVVVILADDLGYSDLGCYGSAIATPNLDSLATDGLRFTQFYNTARCWPTRAALLTGYYAQQVRRDSVPGVKSGGRGERPDWAPLLSEMLKPMGFRSYHSGKWHVDSMPIAEGFDRSYMLQDAGRYFSPRVHFEDDRKLPPVEPGTDWYTTTAIADHAVKSLKEHAEKFGERPFFHYVAFTAPHFPLHALQEDIDRYRDKYRDGWEVARAARWKRIQELGLVTGPLSDVEREIGPPYDFPDDLKTLGPNEVNRPLPWEELTDGQKRFQSDKMAIHAAMVDRMDREIGRILDQLRAMQCFDNTLIMFLSDNGASAEIMVRDDGHDPNAPPGSAASHLCLGPGWSSVCNTPWRRHKTWVHEGGIHTPLVVHWPNGIKSKGELRHSPGHVVDLVPTILDVAKSTGGTPAEDIAEAPSRPGRSLVPAFAADVTVERDSLWWLHEGNRALRVGDWKLVAAKDDEWELYDLAADPAETTNLATKHPEKVAELSQTWTSRRDEFFTQAKQNAKSNRPAANND